MENMGKNILDDNSSSKELKTNERKITSEPRSILKFYRENTSIILINEKSFKEWLASQYLANLFLSICDHYFKEVLGIKFYFRYMDDIIIFSNSKEQLWDWFKKIKIYLKEELALDIKSNYQIFPTNVRGVDFVGYRHFIGYKLLRKSTLKTCKETAKKWKITILVSNYQIINYGVLGFLQ